MTSRSVWLLLSLVGAGVACASAPAEASGRNARVNARFSPYDAIESTRVIHPGVPVRVGDATVTLSLVGRHPTRGTMVTPIGGAPVFLRDVGIETIDGSVGWVIGAKGDVGVIGIDDGGTDHCVEAWPS